ncbi:MAG: helix-turn-helix domain-containing protein [Candidatus Pedobacter colombiensis]|uniref:Helix-turn-helix domain-containing protein n=1 Tax=Candidatus Pedobacter colombiensis TaxID=3121371 RepID=A0AAJ5W9N8_9SPHI|nr:helix-turn-helix domain-containing protein [Pedobacter sp.]WEK20255.1 MAG: helix-turn-helix domain-containing protein [Pedobacter sp.]
MNRLLSVIFISRFGQVLVSLLVNAQNESIFSFFYQIFTPVYYAAPACFYLYVTGFINGRNRLRKFEWLHFIPALLAVVHVLPLPFSPTIKWDVIADQITENKQLFITVRSGIFPPWFYYLGRPFLLLVYLVTTWFAVLKSKVIDINIDASGKKWIFFFLRAATFFQLVSFLPLTIWNLDEPLFNASFILLNCMVLLVIVVFIMHQPKLFYGYLFVAVDLEKDAGVVMEHPKAVVSTKKINLLPDQVSIYSDLMKSFMEHKRPYLQPNFQIVDLANELNIPVHHCSFVINNLIGKNFRDWINSHRIDFFVAEYPLKSDRMTIEAIAYESGFKSMATFYNAFKKETGLMPKAYFLQKMVS